jgi:hypothetical protein
MYPCRSSLLNDRRPPDPADRQRVRRGWFRRMKSDCEEGRNCAAAARSGAPAPIARGLPTAPAARRCAPRTCRRRTGCREPPALILARSQDCGAPMKVCTRREDRLVEDARHRLLLRDERGAGRPLEGRLSKTRFLRQYAEGRPEASRRRVVHEVPCAAGFHFPRLLLMLSPERIGKWRVARPSCCSGSRATETC